jgi:hypothetical protein
MRQSSERVEAVDDVDAVVPPDSPADSLDDPLSVGPPSVEPPSVGAVLPAFRAPLVDERSFFAQPEPRKWIAGVPIAFRIVPSAPQLGQNRGPASWIPWITSTRCVQLEQT